jgi:hypothetical protein
VKIKTSEEIYVAIKELISELKTCGESKLSAILQHRTFQVAWTTRGELFEELIKVLSDQNLLSIKIPSRINKQIKEIYVYLQLAINNANKEK